MNNVVGKLLIVLQLVFSLLFMCFAGAVYSFQQSWRNKAETSKAQVSQRDQQINELKEQHTQELDARRVENEGLNQRATQAEAGLAQIQANIRTLQGELAQTQQQRDKHLADLQVAQAESDARIAETNELRAETKKLRDSVGQQISEIRDLEDRNLELNGRVASAREREDSFVREIGEMRSLLLANRINPRTRISGQVPAEITKVEGKVLATRQNASRSAELVQISIGSDDYISSDMMLDVYRENQYLGRIRITDVYADSAVGIVIESSRNGIIERGDNVTTKL